MENKALSESSSIFDQLEMGEDKYSKDNEDPIYYHARPNIYAVAICGYDEIEITLNGNKFIVHKNISSLFIVISDMVIIFFFVIFIFILDKKKERF